MADRNLAEHMRSAYILCMHALPPAANPDEPTLGAIKQALHELSCANGASLRDAHELLRQLARGNGIDPDDALQRRRATVQLQRERLVRASVMGSGPT
jgi:hypothetical protein